ncbi:hypothetical protein ERJ75_000007400 [Trypanosoma vivax]|nr:hypothetical protein ERJ75_000007400 [Trypanosoma vivax]
MRQTPLGTPCRGLYRRGLLLLRYAGILVLLRVRLQALPRQRPTEEVHEDVANGLKVVSAALLNPDVCVDGAVARCPREALALPVRDVLMRARVAVLLGETKVDDVHVVSLSPVPIRKLSGLMSRCMIPLLWTNSTRAIICSASISVVFRESRRPQKLKRSSSEDPGGQ